MTELILGLAIANLALVCLTVGVLYGQASRDEEVANLRAAYRAALLTNRRHGL
jgi:hypothetical protein